MGDAPRLSDSGSNAPGLSAAWQRYRQQIQTGLETGAIEKLAELGPAIIPVMAQVVADPTYPELERCHAALTLGYMRAETAVDVLGRTLRRESSDMVCWDIVEALEMIDTPSARRALENAGH